MRRASGAGCQPCFSGVLCNWAVCTKGCSPPARALAGAARAVSKRLHFLLRSANISLVLGCESSFCTMTHAYIILTPTLSVLLDAKQIKRLVNISKCRALEYDRVCFYSAKKLYHDWVYIEWLLLKESIIAAHFCCCLLRM